MIRSFSTPRDHHGGILSAVLISLATIGTIVLLIGMLGWWVWGKIENFPDDARPEVVISQHQHTVDAINAIVSAETSRIQAAARLESSDLSPDLLYLALVTENDNFGFDDDKLEVVKRVEFSGHSWTIMNGAGHGTLNTDSGDLPVLLIKQDIDNPEIGEHWLAMFPRPEIADSGN